ncbi:MAG: D-glycero-beta-D-manno-heptose 1-phosphate adenylyltransferase [Candidatus Aminicenantes bacterium]|nr:D-glycero-beta-D-manno-heptose 1-phosphate adenylyltransferase [Candidatus Aminicenantes bacterium]
MIKKRQGARIILDWKKLKELREKWRHQGKKVVFTNGCFDLLHAGHIWLFKKAKELGDILIVAVNSDASLRRLKGPKRPVFPLKERLEILAAIEDIDVLTAFSQDTPQKIISLLRPDILVKGGDWPPDQVVGRKEVEESGGRVILIPYLPGLSTTQLLQKIITYYNS